MIMSYIILERKGTFLVGKNKLVKKYFWSKPKEEFFCVWMGLYKPAKFNNLQDAKEYVNKISKPDVYHEIK
jgi:hypothetical protein